MDAPEADDALRKIDRLPWRQLYVDTVPDSDGEKCINVYRSSEEIRPPRWKLNHADKRGGAPAAAEKPPRKPTSPTKARQAPPAGGENAERARAEKSQRHTQWLIETARNEFADAEVRLSKIRDAYWRVKPEERSALITEFVEPLLADPDWGNRRRAIVALSEWPKSDVEPALQRFLVGSETDFELIAYAKAVLKSVDADPGRGHE
jgi:hypothetical protein